MRKEGGKGKGGGGGVCPAEAEEEAEAPRISPPSEGKGADRVFAEKHHPPSLPILGLYRKGVNIPLTDNCHYRSGEEEEEEEAPSVFPRRARVAWRWRRADREKKRGIDRLLFELLTAGDPPHSPPLFLRRSRRGR